MPLFIRVDGNNQIMTGHVMRCLSIAHAVRALGEAPVFVLAEETMVPVIKQQGFECVCLHKAWNRLEEELDTLVPLLHRYRASALLLDSYAVTEKYMRVLQKNVRLFYIDDLNSFTYPCDVLINYNHYAPLLNYEHRYAGRKTCLLLDSSFAPLRREFSVLPPFVCVPQVHRILITTGGSDPYNIAGQLIEQIHTDPFLQNLTIEVVCGALNTHATKLHALAAQYKNVTIHKNIQYMAHLMQECDVAVTAGGSTLYELCACGIPSVFFTFADNQQYAKLAFADSLMLYAGDARSNEKNCVQKIVQSIRYFSDNLSLRKQMSQDMRLLVDGKGAERLAATLLENDLDSPIFR